ncbi:MAG: hypothetical protein LJE94_14895 [Deltaproteobacteria bacterium]|nr:hypothetical protein [Deltaproteobacteria bacterium]
MLKKEHIRQAIQGIAARDPDIGYTLDTMLGMGRITPARSAPHTKTDAGSGGDFQFLFDGEPVAVRRIIFFNTGPPYLEELLLIQYGRMLKKQSYARKGAGVAFQKAAREINTFGLEFMVRHKIDQALAQLRQDGRARGQGAAAGGEHGSGGRHQQSIRRLEMLRKNEASDSTLLQLASAKPPPENCFRGLLADETPAFFMPFPFCMEALTQSADLNLEFFHVGFLLDCLGRGVADNLYACLVDRRLMGMVYLTLKKAYTTRTLKIQYIASARARAGTETLEPTTALKGVGTLLVAGVWMVWKNRHPQIRELALDSEVGARQFYEGIGFQPRGLSGLFLKKPQGRLAAAIVNMAAHRREMPANLISEIQAVVRDQAKILAKRDFLRRKNRREMSLEAIKACFKPGIPNAIRSTAGDEVNRHRRSIPEYAELLKLMGEP